MVWTDLVYVLAPGERPDEPPDHAVPESTLGSHMSLESGIVPVVPGDDEVRVHSLNEVDLGSTELGTVDRESGDPDVPEGDGVECSFHEHHDLAVLGAVVEEVPGDVDSLGVEVLRAIRVETTPDNTEDISS